MPPPQPEVKARIAAAAADLQRMLPVYALRTGGVLADVLFGLVVAYYWLEARDEILASGPQVLPEEQRPRFLAVCDDIERVLGGYLGGQLILSLLITLASLLAFVAIGLPDPVVLALIGGLLHVVPLIGATIGVIPPILVAVSISPGKGLATAATLLLIHQIENSFVAPRVLQRQVGLSPLLVLIALAAGATLGGVAGALIAVPAAGTLWILARHLLIEPAARRQEAQLGAGGPATSAPAEPDLEQG